MRTISNFEKIKSDNLSGASQIFQLIAICWLNEIKEAKQQIYNFKFEQLFQRGQYILSLFPQMAPIVNLVNHVFLCCSVCKSEAEMLGHAQEAIEALLENLKKAQKSLVGESQKVLRTGITVCTLSFSSQVVFVLKELFKKGWDIKIFLLESRPMNEGRNAALELLKSGLDVTLFVDAAMGYAIEKCDLVLVGADTFSEKNLSNKVATRPLAVLAKDLMKPNYIISTLDKFLPSNILHFEEQSRPDEEVWKELPKGIKIYNRYFEKIPISNFTGLITESGVLKTDELVEMAKIKKMDNRVKSFLQPENLKRRLN